METKSYATIRRELLWLWQHGDTEDIRSAARTLYLSIGTGGGICEIMGVGWQMCPEGHISYVYSSRASTQALAEAGRTPCVTCCPLADCSRAASLKERIFGFVFGRD